VTQNRVQFYFSLYRSWGEVTVPLPLPAHKAAQAVAGIGAGSNDPLRGAAAATELSREQIGASSAVRKDIGAAARSPAGGWCNFRI
jgi:hypothetical protein